MTKRMLIDATHAEETRVVVLDGNRLEDFDVETSAKKQLKGNIYLAKVVRVEPSLQAAFVEYGGGRHGFLAFGEIHPDYYQIPVADRQRLLAMQAEEARAEAEAEEREVLGAASVASDHPVSNDPVDSEPSADDAADVTEVLGTDEAPDTASDGADGTADETRDGRPAQAASMPRDERFGPADAEVAETPVESLDLDPSETTLEEPPEPVEGPAHGTDGEPNAEPAANPDPDSAPETDPPIDGTEERAQDHSFADLDVPAEIEAPPETMGGEAEASGADDARRRRESRFLRNYRIQEVIRRRQIMLIQVVKEERGTKGAALTTYISLAGRFSVLMPNSPRGGGISRKITSAADRRRLKEVTSELDLPPGMGLIVRTAGANRPKPEIKRDCEYLMRSWDDIRELTMRSVAPALIYEEASLIKRAIRDGYSRDIDEVIVDGEPGWRAAHEFMRMLMPAHAKKVQLWRGEGGQPLFAKHQVEAQLDAMLTPTVQLKSGGYLVIDQTEALVAIDVNSGRSTRERNIEETAFRTNLEAADEAARQLRLRDLAGLIVIDFIDMESRKNNAAVERRLKDALRVDRARIQVGSISHFGLLEMSRQRLRPSVTETSFVACPHCGGLGHVRSTESAAIHLLRAIEDEGARARSAVIMVHAASSLVMYLLNHKRDRLTEIETRTGMRVQFAMDETLVPPAHRIDKVRARSPDDRPPAPLPVAPSYEPFEDVAETPDVEDEEAEVEAAPASVAATPAAAQTTEEGEPRRRRRRRRRGGRRDTPEGQAEEAAAAAADLAEGRSGDEATDFDEAGDDEAAGDEAAAGEPRADMPDVERPAIGAWDGDQPHVDPGPSDTAQSTETTQPPLSIGEAGHPLADEAQPPPPPVEAVAEPAREAAPEAEAAEAEATTARRRGRRGGRRRRRDDGTDAPTQEAAQPELDRTVNDRDGAALPYSGPTPADPFGGNAFDIYDLLDTAPFEAASVPKPPLAPEPELAQMASTAATDQTDPEAAPAPMTPPDVAAVVPPEPELEPEAHAAPPPAEPVAAAAAQADTAEAETSQADAAAETPTQPMLIGDLPQTTTEPKRGWWKR